MAVSTAQDFNLDIDQIIFDAFEHLGGPPITGEEAKSARRTLNMILADWQNRGILLWTTELDVTALVSTTATYVLSSVYSDVLQVVIRSSTGGTDTDLEISRIPMEKYQQIPTKSTQGRPVQYAVHRQRSNLEINFWPTPDQSDKYSARLWSIRRFFNFDNSSDDPDVPYRFLPCLVTGLAYYMAIKRPNVSMDRVAVLKTEYDAQLLNAMEEDRQRSDLEMKPRLRVI
tara:strand:+ start:581 stop:1267 length:687 start_codon:yes stop_codon:yes gene_type:complete